MNLLKNVLIYVKPAEFSENWNWKMTKDKKSEIYVEILKHIRKAKEVIYHNLPVNIWFKMLKKIGRICLEQIKFTTVYFIKDLSVHSLLKMSAHTETFYMAVKKWAICMK